MIIDIDMNPLPATVYYKIVHWLTDNDIPFMYTSGNEKYCETIHISEEDAVIMKLTLSI